jgi:hypothetical protein
LATGRVERRLAAILAADIAFARGGLGSEVAAASACHAHAAIAIERNLVRPTDVPAVLAAPFTEACRAAGSP